MASEAIKLLTETEADRSDPLALIDFLLSLIQVFLESNTPSPSMLLYTPQSSSPFRSIKLRQPKQECIACGASSSLLDEGVVPWWMSENADVRFAESMVGAEGGFCGVEEREGDTRIDTEVCQVLQLSTHY
jgi:hypothetical protein